MAWPCPPPTTRLRRVDARPSPLPIAMSLDPRVRTTLLDVQAGRCDVETAAHRLLEVRRETGCPTLQTAATSTADEQRLVARLAELIREESGAR